MTVRQRRQVFTRLGALTVILASAMTLVAAPWAREAPLETPCGTIAPGDAATARLQVAGSHLYAAGAGMFTPYGVSVVGGPQTINWALTEKAAAAQITAADRYWNANAVRIQVSESLLFKGSKLGRSHNKAFVASVDRLVCRVIRQGDIPVLNVTTLFTGRDRGPREQTVRWWRFMAKRYGNHLPVIFDLFNEPQVTRDSKGRFLRPSEVWRIWRSGGTVGKVRYVGMQDLVDAIRIKERVTNVIWAEEPYYLESRRARLDLLPRFQLNGANIMFAFHKPDMRPQSSSFRRMRSVVREGMPLINSEWAQFAATDRPWMCQEHAYTTAPRYLQFLRDAGIGMLAWSLQPGSLVRGAAGRDTVHDGKDTRFTRNPRDLRVPTEMTPSYGCTAAARGQGAGRLAMDYFARYSKRPPKRLFPKLG